jgi:hypothetical protein
VFSCIVEHHGVDTYRTGFAINGLREVFVPADQKNL